MSAPLAAKWIEMGETLGWAPKWKTKVVLGSEKNEKNMVCLGGRQDAK